MKRSLVERTRDGARCTKGARLNTTHIRVQTVKSSPFPLLCWSICYRLEKTSRVLYTKAAPRGQQYQHHSVAGCSVTNPAVIFRFASPLFQAPLVVPMATVTCYALNQAPSRCVGDRHNKQHALEFNVFSSSTNTAVGSSSCRPSRMLHLLRVLGVELEENPAQKIIFSFRWGFLVLFHGFP